MVLGSHFQVGVLWLFVAFGVLALLLQLATRLGLRVCAFAHETPEPVTPKLVE